MKTTPVHQRMETPTETEKQEHVDHEPARHVHELKWHLIKKMVSNQQSFIDQSIDQ